MYWREKVQEGTEFQFFEFITRDAPVFALFAAVAAAGMQGCCCGAAAVPCWGAAGEMCAVYVLKQKCKGLVVGVLLLYATVLLALAKFAAWVLSKKIKRTNQKMKGKERERRKEETVFS